MSASFLWHDINLLYIEIKQINLASWELIYCKWDFIFHGSGCGHITGARRERHAKEGGEIVEFVPVGG